MTNVARTTRKSLDTSSIFSSQGHSLKQIPRGSNALPPSYRLIITTARGVYAWGIDGVTDLFRSGSEGIVAAKKLDGHDGILAVADSQVVVLHDIKRGMQRSYRLKGTEVNSLYSKAGECTDEKNRAKSEC